MEKKASLICCLAGILGVFALAEAGWSAPVNVPQEMQNLKSKKVSQRAAAMRALGRTKDAQATREIIRQVKGKERPDIKTEGILALGAIGNDEAVQALRDTYINEAETLDVRLSALESLSRVRNSETAFTTLAGATADKNPLVRRVAAGLLWQNHYSAHKKRILPLLQKLAQDTDATVRASAKGMLEAKQ